VLGVALNEHLKALKEENIWRVMKEDLCKAQGTVA
jgi:hypothetical protein